ncbi:HEPN domain-containing protein [Desulfatitalea tepidiphila]|uniref:HEPN domain-containing protein n=1 Tax=Desulfatitalea tepidiphila TaxID=1185843 RepID=UPI00097795CE|nr:HEPN domain-containing protein [Desulfatitalea tepidiphila]
MVRKFTKRDGLVPADIVHCALDHLSAAQLLFESNPIHFDSAGYLAHLGVEMLLKAWLLEVAGEFEGTHNLEMLYSNLVALSVTEPLDANNSAILNRLDKYEQLRYPNLNSPTEVGDGDWKHIEILTGFLCRSMPPEIDEALSEINRGNQNYPFRKAGRVLMKKKISNT